MEETEKLCVRSVKMDGETIVLIIETNGKKETVRLDDNLTVNKVRFTTSAIVQSVHTSTIDSQKTLLSVLNRIYFDYRSSKTLTHACLTTIAESNFHEFCEKVLIESFSNNNRCDTEEKRTLTSLVYSTCHNVSDNTPAFVQNIWFTKIIEIIKCNLCNQDYISKRGDEFVSNLITTSMGIMHNVTRHIDASQREILSSKTLKTNLTSYFDWSHEVSLAALFTLSMIIDPDEACLLDNQTAVVKHALQLALGAWESNLRRQDGYHLDELLSGLYYAMRSDELKKNILTKEYVEFFFEIIQMMDRPSEVQGVLIIFKQLSRCPQTKNKLITTFGIVNILKEIQQKAFSHMKSTIQDLIQIYSA